MNKIKSTISDNSVWIGWYQLILLIKFLIWLQFLNYEIIHIYIVHKTVDEMYEAKPRAFPCSQITSKLGDKQVYRVTKYNTTIERYGIEMFYHNKQIVLESSRLYLIICPHNNPSYLGSL